MNLSRKGLGPEGRVLGQLLGMVSCGDDRSQGGKAVTLAHAGLKPECEHGGSHSGWKAGQESLQKVLSWVWVLGEHSVESWMNFWGRDHSLWVSALSLGTHRAGGQGTTDMDSLFFFFNWS